MGENLDANQWLIGLTRFITIGSPQQRGTKHF